MSFVARVRRHLRPSLLLDLAGALLFVLALVATLHFLSTDVEIYDEGIVLTNAKLLGWGYVPYRDFYSNYPPGIFLTLRWLWKLVGVSVLAERSIALFAHLLIAFGAGRVAGRLSGRRFSLFTAGVALAALVGDKLTAYAWLVALGVTFVACELLARCLEKPDDVRRAVVAGVGLGVISFYRHDLFIYFAAALALCVVAGWLATRTLPPLRWSWLVGAALLTVALFWLPLFARTGRQLVNDLYFDQVRWVLPARKLPIPHLFVAPRRPFPAFFGQLFESSVLFTLTGPLVALLAVVRWRSETRRFWLGVPLFAATAAVIPQALGRTDLQHALGAVGPSLAAFGALVEWLLATPRGRWRPVAWPLALALATLLVKPMIEGVRHPARPRIAEPQPDATRRQLMAYVQAHTRSAEPIYNGYRQHRRLLANEMNLYYFLDRPGATRYMQFDPNTINRADVQQHMIEELERKKVRLAVLVIDGASWFEANESRTYGSELLDRYLRRNFSPVARFGNYEVDLRNPAPSASAPSLPEEAPAREP